MNEERMLRLLRKVEDKKERDVLLSAWAIINCNERSEKEIRGLKNLIESAFLIYKV